MSKLGKVFSIIAIVLSLASAGVGVYVATKKTGYMKQLKSTEDSLRAAPMPVPYNSDYLTAADQPAEYINTVNKAFKTTREELKTTQDKATELQAKVVDTEAKVQDLTTKETATRRDLEAKTEELTTAKTKLGEVDTKLKGIMDDLGGREAKQVVMELKENSEKVEALGREKKIIEDALAQKTALVARFEELDRNREKGYAPDDLSGKVMAINKPWNFVVLDVGKDNKLVEGVELLVYRGDALIGKVRSVSVDATSAVADILPDWTKTEIQVGDKVLFGYK
jgi:hypothetical protein